MRRKWIAASLTLTLCAAAGAYALRDTGPWTFLAAPSPRADGHIRIELPAVRIIEPAQLTSRDTAVILRETAEGDEQAPADAATSAEPGVTADFADRTQASDLSQQSPQVAAAEDPNGLLDVNFDLNAPGRLGGAALDIRKDVRFNGTDAGKATIRVGNGSALFIARDDLRTLLVAAERTDLAENLSDSADGSFVGFDEVRQNGLNLRYDPLSDRILISG